VLDHRRCQLGWQPQFVGEGVPDRPAALGPVVASVGRAFPGTVEGRAGMAFAGGCTAGRSAARPDGFPRVPGALGGNPLSSSTRALGSEPGGRGVSLPPTACAKAASGAMSNESTKAAERYRAMIVFLASAGVRETPATRQERRSAALGCRCRSRRGRGHSTPTMQIGKGHRAAAPNTPAGPAGYWRFCERRQTLLPPCRAAATDGR